MSTRFAAFTAATMAKLGLSAATAASALAAAPAAEPAADPAVAPAAAPAATPAETGTTKDQADDAEAERAIADAATQAAAAGAKAECSRWATVMRSAEAKGRETIAIATLEKSPMSADAIIAMLGDMPAGATAFADRMAAEAPNPPVTADGGAEKPAERNALTILRERYSKKG